jgi:Cu2+-exporting ATPase
VVAGSHNLSATVQVRVQGVGEQTRFAQIVALMQSASTTKPGSAALADRLARPFLIAVLLGAGGACLWWWQTDPERAMMVAVAVLVVTCPCALSLATPAAMLAAAGNLARQGVLVRNLPALQAMAEVDCVVFDKTGTLTQTAMAVGSIQTRDGTLPAQALQMAAALASHSLHPVSRALAAAAQGEACGAARWACDGVRETAGQGVEGQAQPAGVAAGLAPTTLRLGSAAYCGVTAMVSDALHVYLSDPSGWLATFELREELRPQAAKTVAALNGKGVQVHLLSGDGADSVARVAAEAGIAQARGACSPADKLQALRALQAQGHKVLMVGDGLNDGPVLAGAHVSVAFGQAVPLAQSQSDFVVQGNQLLAVAHAVALARQTMAVVRQNLWWALLYNAACVPLAVVGWLPAWLAGLGMASSSLVVVLNALRLTGKAQQRQAN